MPLKGKHIGYKGILRDEDKKVFVVEIAYDKSKSDPGVDNARYTNHCKVTRIIGKDGEHVSEVSGYAYKHYRYFVGQEIANENIYFFPVTIQMPIEKAIKAAGTFAEGTDAMRHLGKYLSTNDKKEAEYFENWIYSLPKGQAKQVIDDVKNYLVEIGYFRGGD